METLTKKKAKPPTTTRDDDCLDHGWCCDPDVALCGKDISGHEIVLDPPPEDCCVVCVYMEQNGLRCPVPGCPGDD